MWVRGAGLRCPVHRRAGRALRLGGAARGGTSGPGMLAGAAGSWGACRCSRHQGVGGWLVPRRAEEPA